jgi:ElaB/YqjD/DUF883 family membrane-anchored ribosome-binding protein
MRDPEARRDGWRLLTKIHCLSLLTSLICLCQDLGLAAKESRNEEEDDARNESIKELRKEFDERLTEMQTSLNKALERGKKAVGVDEETIADLRERLDMTRARAMDVLESSEDVIREHPVLFVAGAMAIGILVGALVGRKSSRD